jgi:nucleoside-diphosphate-sugar epimerase
MLIAITGITGFLGSKAVESLSANYGVMGISHSISNHPIFPVFSFQYLEKIHSVPDVILHCHAAVSSGINSVDKETLFEGNVVATEKIINAFPKAKHIYISSTSIYEQSDEMKTELSKSAPVSDYAVSKLQAEYLVLKTDKAVVVRLSSLYGIGMKENTIIPNYINQALTNHVIEVWGTGGRMQNYIHVTDVINLIEQVIQRDIWDKKIYLGVSDKEYSNVDLAQLISNFTNAEIKFVNSDSSLSNHFDNRFTRNELNWQPLADISSEIKKIIEWKQKQS